MAKKFNTQAVTDKFFTQGTDEELKPQETEEMQKTQKTVRKQGRPKKQKKLRGYRYNLHLDRDLKPFLTYIAWQRKTSITQYINDLIRDEMDDFIKNGGTIDPDFFDDEE